MAIILPFYKTPNISIKTSIQAVGAIPSIQATVVCIGHRNPEGNQTQIAPLAPASGYPQLQYFQPFAMPTFSSGYEALSYMQNLGFTVNYGLSGTLLFPAPNTVTTNTNGTVTLTYTAMPANYNLLLTSGVSATVTQATSTATGVFASASSTNYSITLSGVTGTFVTTSSDLITLSYINNNLGLPDPNRTEEICMQVFYMYQAMNQIVAGGQYNFIKPNIVLSVLTDRETSGAFAPNPSSVSLGIPTATAIQTDGSVYIGYATQPANGVYVPLTQLGNSVISQLTSLASGTILGVLPPQTIAGSNFVIHVGSVTGTFDTTHAASMVLDSSQSVFVLMDTVPMTAIVNPYNVATNTDVSTNQAAFFQYIVNANQPTEVEKGHFGVFGVFTNTTISPQQMSTLPNNVNYNWYAPVYYPYAPLVGEYPQTAAMIAAAYAVFMSCNSAPYNPMSLVTIPGVLSSANIQNRVVYGLTGSTASEIALQLGWSPLCVNASGQVFAARLVTGQITVPGSGVIDEEFFPVSTWQIVAYFQQQLYVDLLLAGVKQIRMTPQSLTKIKGVVIATMMNFQNLGMFENVAALSKLVTVQQSNIPDTVIIQVPITVIPELASANVQVGLISSLISVGST
jgi:hypothetical protein